jgi:rfaE bifunctional protein nucleotidyltransferase chain/domain
MSPSKLISFDEANAFFTRLKTKGKCIVQSHGVFDLVHPGHVLHLEEARSFGDLLVVTISSDAFVGKGPGRPYFKEALRVQALSALSCVDYIVVIPQPGAEAAIRCISPSIYCKGKEYQEALQNVDECVLRERNVVEALGGELRFAGGVKYSSTKLLNRHFDHLGASVRTFCHSLSLKFSRAAFLSALEELSRLKILVMGDTIFDRYTEVAVQGLTSKNRIISSRFLREETHAGGALAVFRHVREFVPNVRYLSLMGEEAWANHQVAAIVPPDQDLLVRDPSFTTVLKQRFVEPAQDDAVVGKLFSVNYLNHSSISQTAVAALEKRVRSAVREVDAVLLLDFGHGMMHSTLREMIQSEAPKLILNCQTNSNNHGFNIINRQYERADAFSLDEQEMLLAVGKRGIDYFAELQSLKAALKSEYCWLTRGSVQTIGLRTGELECACPPLGSVVRDTVGAGDAFFSVAALAAVAGHPVDLSTFLGQLAGDQAIRIVGNATPISKQTLLTDGLALLNF